MSKIVIIARNVHRRTEFLARLRRVTGLGLYDLAARVDAARPLVEVELFGNDHNATAGQLRGILAAQEHGEAEFQIFELRADETFDRDAGGFPRKHAITPTTLANILDRFQDKTAEQ